MTVYTDSPQFATTFLPSEVVDGFVPSLDLGDPAPPLHPSMPVPGFGQAVGDSPVGTLDASFRELLKRTIQDQRKLHSAPLPDFPLGILLLSESSEGSQYDLLIEMARNSGPLPDRLACLAGSGSGFHGFKGRPWASPPGNIYLAVHFAPRMEIPRFEVAFTVLATLSVVDTLDHIAGLEGRARIKWVNDILLGEGKVGGVLAYTQTQGRTVTSAVLGIGLNVNTVPQVKTTPFVPVVSSVREALNTKAFGLRATVFHALARALDRNYEILLQEGVTPLLERYRQRSIVIGEDVVICSETSDQDIEIITQGRVLSLGDNLELVMEGNPDPVTGGRLVLGPYEEMISEVMEGDL